MTAATPMTIPKKSQDGIIQFNRQCYQMLNQQWNIREQMRQIDLKYIREVDWTENNIRAIIANRYGDPTRFRNITVPVVMPQVENAVTYQASVFLTGSPIFGVVSDPTNEDAALQMETVIDDQATRGGWIREFILFLRDGFKYNLAAIECNWNQEVSAVFEQDINFTGGAQAKPKEVIWAGNKVKRLDMYNTFFDSRVHPSLMYKDGEFSGYTELMSRIKLKSFIASLPTAMFDNITAAFESGYGTQSGGFGTGGIESYFIPQINPWAIMNKNPMATTNWLAWAGLQDQSNQKGIQYKNLYEVTTIYGRILPSDFGLRTPQSNTPQVWKFIIVNQQVLIYAERQTNAHNYIPILFSQPLEDGLAYQTKSLAQNVEPIQDVSSAFMNSAIASARRRISDRVLYNPALINAADINSENPAAKIPVRPNAFGKSLQEAVYHFPYDSSADQYAMQQISQLGSLANQISGQNPARQGQFVKGNKTLEEYSDVMSHSNGRDQLTSMLLEAQIFTPLKEIIKINNIQYQGGTTLYNRNAKQTVTVDPVALRNAVMTFKVSDGLLPTSKIINGDAWTVAMQVMGSSQAISSQYDMAGLFSYLMKQKGADVSEFEKSPQEQAYEQAMQMWMQATQQAMEEIKQAVKAVAPGQESQFNQIIKDMKALLPPMPTQQQFGVGQPNPQQKQSPVQPTAATPQQGNQSQPNTPGTVSSLTSQLTGAVANGQA